MRIARLSLKQRHWIDVRGGERDGGPSRTGVGMMSLLVSVFAVAATHAPFLSAPPFASHFILAFAQSALLVGAVCANAAGANAIAPATAAIMRSFMLISPCLT